jgi:hypothetical protein
LIWFCDGSFSQLRREAERGEDLERMSESEGPFFQAGADGVLLADFRGLADGGRYPIQPVMAWHAKFVVGRGGGANKDSPLFELCHLVAALDAFGGGADARWMFFLGIDRVVPRRVKSHLETELAVGGVPDCLRLTGDGLAVQYPDGAFQVRYGRMPFLIALYEFLTAMDGFSFAEEMTALFDAIAADGPARGAVRSATNAIAARLRRYRREHMTWARNDEKLDPVHRYLCERLDGNSIVIDDAVVLDFWRLHSQGDEFRGYRTVFDTFIRYMRAMTDAERGRAAESAAAIGLDVEQGEVDPADDGDRDLAAADWCSPFDIFDRDELAAINFFKGASERKPIETLMRYGPDAMRLPLAFLRLESFGPIQSAITTDLQVKRGPASVARRIACGDAQPYDAQGATYDRLRAHVETLQKAALHAVLTGGTGEGRLAAVSAVADDGANDDRLTDALVAAERAFAGISRRGFETLGDDDPRIEAFRLAAGALVTMSRVLGMAIDALGHLDRTAPGLVVYFEGDRDIFSRQFAMLYGDAA